MCSLMFPTYCKVAIVAVVYQDAVVAVVYIGWLPCSSYDVSTSDLRKDNVPFVEVPRVKFFVR
jgi:hypothetical protein